MATSSRPRTVTVRDYRGRFWCVRAGDPAYAATVRLERAGFGLVVLPGWMLRGREPDGELPRDPILAWRASQCRRELARQMAHEAHLLAVMAGEGPLNCGEKCRA